VRRTSIGRSAAVETSLLHRLEDSMKRILTVALMLGLFGIAMAGCRASGEIKDQANVSLTR